MKNNKLQVICKYTMLFCLLMLLGKHLPISTFATPIYELGKRNLKLGNTYREAGNNSLALKYLNRGKSAFKKQQNKEEQYWFAVANEYLFYFYRDINDMESAQEHLNIATAIYDKAITQKDGSAEAVKQLLSAPTFGTDWQLENVAPKDDSSAATQYLSPTYGGQQMPPANIEVNLNNRNLNDFPRNYINYNAKEIEIYLQNNQFEEIPEAVLECVNLIELNMASNRLKTCDLHDLHKLKYLNLSDNQITEIGQSIGTLSNLEQLILSNNTQLDAISGEIQNLKQLKVLDVRNTALSERAVNELINLLPAASVLYNFKDIQTIPSIDSDTDNSFWEDSQATEEEPDYWGE